MSTTKLDPKVCVTTFVFGRKYQGYIPLLIYSLLKSYPDYVPIIFVHYRLRDDIACTLKELRSLGHFIVKDNYFNEFKTLNTFEGKSLRWILQDDIYLQYDYVYYVDIDIIYIKEFPPLHEQHIEHMNVLQLPFSNACRLANNRNRTCHTFMRRVKNYGINNAVINFIRGNKTEKQLTGLHFVKTDEYFPAVDAAQKKYKQLLLSGKYLSIFQGFKNEALLYTICRESGFDLSNVATQSNLKGLDFKDYTIPCFRPHHGIHLGVFRGGGEPIQKDICDSITYKYYVKTFLSYLDDPLFIKVLKNADPFISEQLSAFFKYYNISYPT